MPSDTADGFKPPRAATAVNLSWLRLLDVEQSEPGPYVRAIADGVCNRDPSRLLDRAKPVVR